MPKWEGYLRVFNPKDAVATRHAVHLVADAHSKAQLGMISRLAGSIFHTQESTLATSYMPYCLASKIKYPPSLKPVFVWCVTWKQLSQTEYFACLFK
eukprot:3931350-Amphidinium_carterae.1